jgi:hypothetical protein
MHDNIECDLICIILTNSYAKKHSRSGLFNQMVEFVFRGFSFAFL